MTATWREIIIVRALTDSDLGIFAAHRADATSKQRAININAQMAQRLISKDIFQNGGTYIDCICYFEDIESRSSRHFGKVHKNWRLGGDKIEGAIFGKIDSSDFALIRSPEGNDGSSPIVLTFISRSTDRVRHAAISALVTGRIKQSMLIVAEGEPDFSNLAGYCPELPSPLRPMPRAKSRPPAVAARPVLPMPEEIRAKPRPRTIHEKINSPHIIEQMMKVASDLSAPAQLKFLDTVEQLASQLRTVLLKTGRIIRIERDHAKLWKQVAGKPVGFVDGGMANLSMLGSAPIAVRVGGYVVTPGDRTPEREQFIVLKKLISELYAAPDGGVYDGGFPDIGALRDAARISIEAAGGVRILQERADLKWLFLHGALVNPASRYSDVMRDGKTRYAFPAFSKDALKELLPGKSPVPEGRDANFISVYLDQLTKLATSSAVVCGVVERESHTTTVMKGVLKSLDDEEIRSFLPLPPAQWKDWFLKSIDPVDDDEAEGQRITDPLLFRCVLEAGEALLPVPIDRNDMRRAPDAWKDKVIQYPRPLVSYVQPTEWNAPIRIEIFEKDQTRFAETASLILHCSLLLPRYAFPAGLDIVDKFAKIPDWMSKPVNTHTAVQTLRRALDHGDTKLFDALRRMMCGSQREWLYRPGIMR